MTHTLRARYVFLAAGPPLADGAVTIEGQRIAAVLLGLGQLFGRHAGL